MPTSSHLFWLRSEMCVGTHTSSPFDILLLENFRTYLLLQGLPLIICFQQNKDDSNHNPFVLLQMVGGALYIRRFMMKQYLALADQVPFGSLLLSLHRSMGKGGLISPDEAAFIRQSEELDPSVVKVVFSTRAPRNFGRGVAGATWNVVIGTLLAPVVGLAMVPHQIHQHGFVKGLVPGLVMGNVWGAAFALLGYTAAVQQLLFGLVHQCAAPVHYLFTNRHWSVYTCRFITPLSSGSTSGLEHEPSPKTLKEYGMRRVARSKNDKEKSDAKYKSPNAAEKTSGTLYDILGVSSSATDKEIKEAYTKMAMKLHPDRNPSKDAHDQFDALTKAYRTLSNADKRKKYDVAGQDGLDDLGSKKRDGVRALFGGDQLQRLVGDVRMGSFSLRVIDGLDYTPDELGIVWMRMLDEARDALLQLLDGFSISESPSTSSGSARGASVGSSGSVATSSATASSWNAAVRGKVHRFINTGLAKEVLYAVGREYLAVCAHAEASAARRVVSGLASVLPHRLTVRANQVRALAKARPSMAKDTAMLIDLAWYLSLSELEYTARFCAWSVLHDPSVAPAERERRLQGLKQLGTFFVASGKEYSGANKSTVDSLMDSLRSYQQAKARADQQQ